MSKAFDTELLIAEVRKRPGIYGKNFDVDRDEKLSLWKEIGAAVYRDWPAITKAEAYDRVLELQRKWRSVRDALNRELRLRRLGKMENRKPYVYLRQLRFLTNGEGQEDDDQDDRKEKRKDILTKQRQPVESPQDISGYKISVDIVQRCKLWAKVCSRPDLVETTFKTLRNAYVCSLHFERCMYGKKSLKKTAVPTLLLPTLDSNNYDGSVASDAPEEKDPLLTRKRPNTTRKKIIIKRQKSDGEKVEVDVPFLPIESPSQDEEEDSDRLFLLSFVQEMGKLPSHIKMWARAQIASVMQQAVTCDYNNSLPERSGLEDDEPVAIKRQRLSISEETLI